MGSARVYSSPLCVCLFDERAPELVVVPGAEVDQVVVAGGQTVVDHYLVPIAKPGEIKIKCVFPLLYEKMQLFCLKKYV